MARKHLFIVNPLSFANKGELCKFIYKIELCFAAYELEEGEEFRIYQTTFPRDGSILVQKYLDKTDPSAEVRVYAVGGDGVLFDCLNGLVGYPNASIGIIPVGTNSDFAGAFGKEQKHLFLDIDKQIHAPSVSTDIIRCGNNYAINHCVIGLDGAARFNLLKARQKFQKIRHKFKWLESIISLVGRFITMFDNSILRQEYHIEADGEIIDGNFLTINIANGPYYAIGRSIVPYALPNDGLLEMIAGKGNKIFKAVSLFADLISGKYYKHPDLTICRSVKKIIISSKEELLVCVDGEAYLDNDLIIELIPSAVKFIAPDGIPFRVKEARRG